MDEPLAWRIHSACLEVGVGVSMMTAQFDLHVSPCKLDLHMVVE